MGRKKIKRKRRMGIKTQRKRWLNQKINGRIIKKTWWYEERNGRTNEKEI